MPTIDDRFWSKVIPAAPEECWHWAASTSPEGYGSFRSASGKNVGAHCWAYESLRAEIPAGLVLDHLCRNRACVNPWHLEPVTQRVNVLRGLPFIEWPDMCPQGHEFTEANTSRTRRGHRRCVTCNRLRARRNYAKRKAA
ncbi:HNH endonuclease signature motif containing protein [Streptomyces sp. STCH 565 A]|uniref:HNH endonuclease signature motif containing protein n=1 Tax=Streptomyces sp. STCH 565 A TaxID=2950532 RepID=UPI0020753511|nr:HNH endonuclease signature motif containing protein [Streptomyces sp. STCH 565 A]MCM8555654.1 HNH endonuclease [Streptomyces sp. STCH 565 A]